MGSAPETTLGLRVFQADYFPNSYPTILLFELKK